MKRSYVCYAIGTPVFALKSKKKILFTLLNHIDLELYVQYLSCIWLCNLTTTLKCLQWDFFALEKCK